MEKITEQGYLAAKEIIEKAKLQRGNLLVVGCSTSEVVGDKIGTNSSPETAIHIYKGFKKACDEAGVYLAAQCCEHLNRAIITEAEAAKNYDPVNVGPQPKAGGSFATAAYIDMNNPVALEEISADACIDIGFTMIGMQIKKVAVPVRLENNKIGNATVLAARSRPKFIGGVRATYNEELL